MLRRYAHGPTPGVDDPLVWWEGSTMNHSARNFLYSDERGSIVAITDQYGENTAINTYDDYGVPRTGGGGENANTGRFQYTGQTYIPELGLYYYKARMYSPELGRFMQTDPIGYGDGMNMYRYVGNDPVNAVDPSGMIEVSDGGITCDYDVIDGEIVVNWCRYDDPIVVSGSSGGWTSICNGNCGSLVVQRENFDENGNLTGITLVVDTSDLPQSDDYEIPVDCDALFSEPGAIEVWEDSGTLILLGGITGSIGSFRNVETGSHGRFFSLGGGAGWDTGISSQYQRFRSLSDVAGFGATLQAGSLVSGSLTWNSEGDFVGGGAGIATPGKGGSGVLTGTKLHSCYRHGG